jgi:type IV secretory pathway TrbD component
MPTVVKAYRQPETENYSVFLFGAISAGITLLTIKTWNLANYGFPIYILAICALLFALIKFPNLRPSKLQSTI